MWILQESMRLNPYYTGIHLHTSSKSDKTEQKRSLNPYYTGIHLHTGRRKSAIGGCRLNPYYTGIHLHD